MSDAITRAVLAEDAVWTLEHYAYLYYQVQNWITQGWSEEATLTQIRSYGWHGSYHRDKVLNAAKWLYQQTKPLNIKPKS